MEGQPQKLEREFEELYKLLSNNEQLLSEVGKKELVAFVGPMASGKSTIISHLLGVPLESVRLDGSRFIRESNSNEPRPHPQIGHNNMKSCTEMPEPFLEEELNIYLCDTPGLEPVRPELKLLTDVFLQKAQKIRAIVVVITMGCLCENRGAQFKDLIKDICKTFDLQQIRSRLIFMYNKIDEQDQLKDIFDKLCKMESEAHDLLGQSLDINQEHMRMFELIFGKNGYDELNDFACFQKSNILVHKKELTEQKSGFRTRLFDIIKEKGNDEKVVKINIDSRRIALANFLNRRLICKQLDVRDCQYNLELYKQAVIIKRCLEDSSESQPLENIINNAVLTSNKELEMGIRTIEGHLKDLEEEETLVKEIIVTNGLPNSKGSYEFKLNMQPTQKLVFECYGGKFTHTIDTSSNTCNGVFEPNKREFQATIKILDGQKYRSQSIIAHMKQKLEQAYRLRKVLMEKGSEELKELLNDKSRRSDIRARHTKEYIESILNSYKKMIEQMHTPEDLQRYFREFFVVSYINVVKGNQIDPKKIEKFKKHSYFYTQSSQEALLRCCVHRHLIERIRQLSCGHFIEQGCWETLSKNDRVRCGICQKQQGSLPEPTRKAEVQEIRNNFNKHFGF